ncbi:MAG: hypothetical protein OEL50_00005, partial [Rhodospirillaceae bacterium]|nr:hypothetical protein [Rhodospirillaceae bacterium]
PKISIFLPDAGFVGGFAIKKHLSATLIWAVCLVGALAVTTKQHLDTAGNIYLALTGTDVFFNHLRAPVNLQTTD